MNAIDRVFASLLLLGGLGHTAGSFATYHDQPFTLLWSLCAALFVFLLGALNLLRTSRSGDRAIAGLCLGFGLAWIVACFRFAQLNGSLLEPHALVFTVITLVLCAFAVRTLVSAAGSRA